MVDEQDHAKLGDFGIARSADDAALTRTGLVTGSPAYLAPEVASGSVATTASDVWSLGATQFHAVVGRAPYDMGQNVLGGLYRIVHDDPPRLPEDHPLAAALAGMMQKDPDERWWVERVRDELRRAADPTAATATDNRPDSEATLTLGAVPGPAAATSPQPPRASPPVPASAPPRRDGLPLARIVTVAALVLLIGLGAWFLWPDDDGSDSTAEAPPAQSQEPEPSDTPSSEQAADGPTTEPTTEPTTAEPSPADDASGMQAFVDDYFSRVTSDPESTFELLTPEFQAESGGFDDYSGFWSTIESASASDIRADVDAMAVSYTITYVTTSGRTTTQQGRLLLQESGDGYLIAGEG